MTGVKCSNFQSSSGVDRWDFSECLLYKQWLDFYFEATVEITIRREYGSTADRFLEFLKTTSQSVNGDFQSSD
jgi:hypothetical protein